MGIWRFAGAFAVVKRQSECGSKTAGMHVSQPMDIGVCWGQGVRFQPSCRAEKLFLAHPKTQTSKLSFVVSFFIFFSSVG